MLLSLQDFDITINFSQRYTFEMFHAYNFFCCISFNKSEIAYTICQKCWFYLKGLYILLIVNLACVGQDPKPLPFAYSNCFDVQVCVEFN